MAKRIGIVAVSLFLASGLLTAMHATAAEKEAVDAKTVAEHLDKTKYSSSDIRSYMKDLKDKQVTVTGKVQDVVSGKTGTKVVIHLNVPNYKYAFVVDVQVSDAGDIHKGDMVSCKGEYIRSGIFGIVLKGSCAK